MEETRGKYSKGKSIARGTSRYTAEEAGHWEADTVVSGQAKAKACFATLAERKTRFYIAMKMSDRRAETMENAIVAALSAFPPQLVKTITDRGTELPTGAALKNDCIARSILPTHIVPGRKVQTNLNGLLREFYPKGRNLPVCCSRHINETWRC